MDGSPFGRNARGIRGIPQLLHRRDRSVLCIKEILEVVSHRFAEIFTILSSLTVGKTKTNFGGSKDLDKSFNGSAAGSDEILMPLGVMKSLQRP